MDTVGFTAAHTETVLDAPPERVWAVLADLPGWNGWNPTLFAVGGPAQAGTDVRMKLRLGRLTVPMRQEIRMVDPPRELAWRSRQAWPAAFDVVRRFVLEPMDGGRTRLIQTETATGFLARPIVAVIGGMVTRGYDDLGRALARRLTEEGR